MTQRTGIIIGGMALALLAALAIISSPPEDDRVFRWSF
jgi:hypothetical protein